MLCSHLFDRVFEFLVQPKIRYKYLNLLYGLSLANPSLFVNLVVELFAQGIHFDLLSGHRLLHQLRYLYLTHFSKSLLLVNLHLFIFSL